jgi:hypothetical protein
VLQYVAQIHSCLTPQLDKRQIFLSIIKRTSLQHEIVSYTSRGFIALHTDVKKCLNKTFFDINAQGHKAFGGVAYNFILEASTFDIRYISLIEESFRNTSSQ